MDIKNKYKFQNIETLKTIIYNEFLVRVNFLDNMHIQLNFINNDENNENPIKKDYNLHKVPFYLYIKVKLFLHKNS